MSTLDEYWMKQAIEQAKLAEKKGEVPVGAIAVCEKNGVVAMAHNQTLEAKNPLLHAEIVAIKLASQKLEQIRLPTVSLYVTLEPCPMCAGAIVQARLKRLIFATRDVLMGAAGTVLNCVNHQNFNHYTSIDEGFYQEEASLLLKEFFKKRRG